VPSKQPAAGSNPARRANRKPRSGPIRGCLTPTGDINRVGGRTPRPTKPRLACEVFAGLSLPLSLTDAAVDTFPQHVGVAAVAGVLLNHVDQYRAQLRATAVRPEALNG
jgi:hypothetical protein